MKFLNIFTYITLVACILANNMSLTCFMLLLCGTILTTYFINKHKLYGNFAKYIVLLGIYFSVIVMPAFHLILHTNGPLQIEYDRFLDFGSKLYFLTILVLTLFDNRQHKIESRIEHQYYPIKLSDNFIRFFFILIYSLTNLFLLYEFIFFRFISFYLLDLILKSLT